MTEKFDKNIDPEPLDGETPLSANYAANFNKNSQESPSVFSASNRTKFWFFLILVVFIVIISGSKFYYNIFEPLKYEVPESFQAQLDAEQNAAKTIAELKESDTDQDGLTDYQELYQYYTSIFLPDTDSDGFTDAEEVSLGEDPLCPTGESCNLLRLITPTTKLSSIVEDITLDSNLTVQQAAVIEFRKFLESEGMEKEDLDALSDEDLLAIFRIVDDSNILNSDELTATTTPDQIRKFLLLLPGVNTDEINAMSDDELMAISENLIVQ